MMVELASPGYVSDGVWRVERGGIVGRVGRVGEGKGVFHHKLSPITFTSGDGRVCLSQFD